MAGKDQKTEYLSEPIILKVVTFNIRDLYLVEGNRVNRMRSIGKKFAELNPDIIGVQEAFVKRDRRKILKDIQNTQLRYNLYYPSGLVGSGLFILSAFPIKKKSFLRYSKNGKWYKLWHGDWWVGKGAAHSRIQLPDNQGYLDFFNTHTHAQYYINDEYHETRCSQMNELGRFIQHISRENYPSLVVGDFNCEPGSLEYKIAVEEGNLTRMMDIPSKLDHIFAVKNPKYNFEVLDTQGIAHYLPENRKIFRLSDHKCYMSTIRITPNKKK